MDQERGHSISAPSCGVYSTLALKGLNKSIFLQYVRFWRNNIYNVTTLRRKKLKRKQKFVYNLKKEINYSSSHNTIFSLNQVFRFIKWKWKRIQLINKPTNGETRAKLRPKKIYSLVSGNRLCEKFFQRSPGRKRGSFFFLIIQWKARSNKLHRATYVKSGNSKINNKKQWVSAVCLHTFYISL